MQQPKCKCLKAQSQQSVLIIGRPSDVRGKRTIRIILLFAVGEAVTIFDANTVGPRSYIRMYDSYRDILTGDDTSDIKDNPGAFKPFYLFQGQSEKDKDAFLASDASLEQFKARMDG